MSENKKSNASSFFIFPKLLVGGRRTTHISMQYLWGVLVFAGLLDHNTDMKVLKYKGVNSFVLYRGFLPYIC